MWQVIQKMNQALKRTFCPPVPQKKEITHIGNKVVSIVTLHFTEKEESCIRSFKIRLNFGSSDAYLYYKQTPEFYMPTYYTLPNLPQTMQNSKF